MNKRERPHNVPSETQRIDTGYGKVYVTLTFDEEGRVFEVFIDIGKSGGFVNSWCNALGMVISTGLRSGVDPNEIADVLMGIRTDKVMEDNGDLILSIPDAVGVAIKRHIEDKVGETIREEPPEIDVQ